MPAPVTPVFLPKSEYSQRPGALLPYRDRVLLQAIVMCLAPSLDPQLSDGVWSWRVRPELRGKYPDQVSRRGLFNESDISQFPFLKKRTITRYIEQFEPWYALWPRFERQTLSVLLDDKFKFVVFSDISAYFENIDLTLLHSILLRGEPHAPNTINLLLRHLRSWTPTSFDGSQGDRGIPQGNSISSFLGNYYLKPVDDLFSRDFSTDEVRYFRYMDDIRLVATTREVARKAALALETQIRRLRLNLQSSKTEIHTSFEAKRRITDRRLDMLEVVSASIRQDKPKEVCLEALVE